MELKQKYFKVADIATYLGVSITTAKKFADSINARRKLGKRNLIDIDKINEYFHQQELESEALKP